MKTFKAANETELISLIQQHDPFQASPTQHDSGDHCPMCFNAGYDSGLNGISQQLRDAAPEMLEALRYASQIIGTARRYFPKSIHNHDTFQLENTCAAIGKAIAKASGLI